MATKGVAEVTVLDQTDATAVRCWYQISASATLPLAPTTTDASATPSEWSRSEPSITSDEDAAKYVYACWQTVWGDGTCDWGDVSMSASFEAAKRAWNMAHSTQQNLDNLRVGGTNLIVHNETSLGRLDTNGAPYTSSNGGYHLYTKKIPVIGGMPYVLSWFYKVTEYATSYLYVSWFTSEDAHINRSTLVNIYNLEPDSYKLTAPDAAAYAVVSMSLYLCVRCAVKFEQGHVPTDLSLSEEDAACPPNMLRGTNQPGILLGYNDASGTWENGLWRVGSGTETSGSAELIPIDDFEDSRQRYGFRVWSTTTGNKDIAQMYVPYKADTYYRVSGFVRLTKNSNQTSATLQFRLYTSSALKTYTKAVDSEEWTKFTYVFSLTEAQAALSILTLLGVKGKGSLEYCALYLKRGYVHSRMSMGETYLPWQPATEDYATYGEASSRLSQAEQALEDAESTVVATHRIYYRTATAQPKPTSPTAWVPEAQSNVYNAWTTKKPPLAASVAETVDTYPYLYTCEQRELLGGGIECTDVQLDESATVIDGSMIINGSVAAQQIAAHSITTNELNTNQLTIGVSNISDFNATVSEAIDNAINLTPFFSHGPTIGDTYWSGTSEYYAVLEDGWGRYELTTSSSTVNRDVGILPQTAFEQGVEYTVLFEWRNFTGTGEIHFAPTVSGASNTNRQISISENSFAVSDISETSGSDRRFITCALDADSADRFLVWRAATLENSSLSIEIRVSIYKGRYYGGYRPYIDQSLRGAVASLDNELCNVQSDVRSFCPTSFNVTDSRWYTSLNSSIFTKLDDGWYHIEADNTSGTSALSYYVIPRNWGPIEPGKEYTILFEIKNFSGVANTETNSLGYMQQYNGAQFWGNATIETLGRRNHTTANTYFYANDISDNGDLTLRMIKMSDTEHVGDDAPYNGICFRYRLYATAGYVTSYDFRISIYPGKYYGEYTPYLVNSAHAEISNVEASAANAAKTATNYITDVTGDGIWITPEDAKPVNGAAASTTSGWHIADMLELFRAGASVFKVWTESAATKVRIGAETVMHLLLTNGKILFMSGNEEVSSIEASTTSYQRNTYHRFGNSYLRASQSTINPTYPNNGISIVADHGLDSDTSSYGYDASVSVSSAYLVAGGFESTVSIHGSQFSISSQNDAASIMDMDRARDHIAGGALLFRGSYADTHNNAVTLTKYGVPVSEGGALEDASNYATFRVFCQDGDGQVTSVDVDAPQGKTFTVTMSTATQTRLYIKSKSFYINGSSITCPRINNTYYRHGQMELGTGVSTWDQNAELIGIIRVLGFR